MANECNLANGIRWEKRFNVGLTLDTNIKEFSAFLDSYSKYIHSFFFSPPLGKAFQSRTVISRQFDKPKKEKLFWQMLKLIKSYGVRLEVLFNTAIITDEDILTTKNLLDSHGVEVDSVCFIETYYYSVCKYFPNKEYVYSFNNGHLASAAFEKTVAEKNVDTFVLGGASIRDNEFFKKIKDSGKNVILLLNNGCSFYCSTCSNGRKVCKATFERNLKKHSVEYLYALQSVFPNELTDGTLDVSQIDLFKISNRSSNIRYTKAVMDSYMTGEVKKYVRLNKLNYSYWGRLGHFWKYFFLMRFKKIKAYKEEILGHAVEIK